jgi:hypothetical protein
MNERFFGAWLLESFESERTDGTRTRPWGDDPLGMIVWDPTGHFAVQVGPRQADRSDAYVSFFGTAYTDDDGESGTIVLRVRGSSAPERVGGDQVRRFLFVDADVLRMRPPVGADGSQSTFTWRRAPAVV